MNDQKDSIIIELVVGAVQMEPDNIWMQGSLEIFINTRKPYHESSDIIDVNALLQSMEEEGKFFIFSCCCGVPSCSGWEKGISVKHKGDTIEWTNGNTNETWILERQCMEEDIATIRTEVMNFKKYFAEKDIRYVGVGYTW